MTQALHGSHVDAVAFGTAYFQLRLSNGDGSYSVTSSADIKFARSGEEARDFRDATEGAALIELIGAEWASVEVADDCRSATIQFKQGQTVHAWWPDKAYDNLFIVRRDGSDEWSTIG
jgi:hypothetical protein